MNLLFIGSSIRKLKMYFKNDFNNEDINYMNDFLKYGFIGETYNNEPI